MSFLKLVLKIKFSCLFFQSKYVFFLSFLPSSGNCCIHCVKINYYRFRCKIFKKSFYFREKLLSILSSGYSRLCLVDTYENINSREARKRLLLVSFWFLPLDEELWRLIALERSQQALERSQQLE